MKYRVKTDNELTRELGTGWRSIRTLYWSSYNEKCLGTILDTDGIIYRSSDAEKTEYIQAANMIGGIVLAVLEELSDLEF